jgi:RNA polymerase sigma-70 factor (ECF subfamily)
MSSEAPARASQFANANERDVRLIERILAGDSGLFSDLIEPYRRSVYGTALAVLHDAADAEEATQDAILKAFLHLGSLRAGATFKAWLLQIALNEARMRLRSARRRPTEPITDETSNEEAPSEEPRDRRELPSEALQRKETRRAITEAMGSLSEPFREVFILREIEQLSVEETAKALNVSNDVVRTRLHRARSQMREKLKLEGTGAASLRHELTGMAGAVEYSVAADSPREVVWATLIDWQSWPHWERIRGLYGNVYWSEGEPWHVGSRFVFEHRARIGVLPFTFDAYMLVTGLVPGERITWINHGFGVTVQQSTDLAHAEGGGTIISTSAEFLGKPLQQAPYPFQPEQILRNFITNFYDALAQESGRRPALTKE